jgi:hypothetical protein
MGCRRGEKVIAGRDYTHIRAYRLPWRPGSKIPLEKLVKQMSAKLIRAAIRLDDLNKELAKVITGCPCSADLKHALNEVSGDFSDLIRELEREDHDLPVTTPCPVYTVELQDSLMRFRLYRRMTCSLSRTMSNFY